MRIMIIGAGQVGTSIAFGIIAVKGFGLFRNIEEICLYDIDPKKLKSELLDLRRAKEIFRSNGFSIDKAYEIHQGYDIYIICAGNRRKPNESDKDLFSRNFTDISEIIKEIKSGKIIMVSNPASMLAKFCIRNNGVKIEHAGDRCDDLCDAKLILAGKEYTNWGIAAEVLNILDQEETLFSEVCDYE